MLWGGLIILLGLVKFIMFNGKIRIVWNKVMYGLMFSFGWVSVFMICLFNCVDIECLVYGELFKDCWYLIIVNYLSYFDIILFIEFVINCIFVFKFFFKKELIWLLFVGFGVWVFDMLFMYRYICVYLEKYLEKKGKDFEIIKVYCEKFRMVFIMVINFVEGIWFILLKYLLK